LTDLQGHSPVASLATFLVFVQQLTKLRLMQSVARFLYSFSF